MDFRLDYAGLGRYLASSPELQIALVEVAQDGADKIRPAAPVGRPSDPHRGAYKAAIHGVAGKGAKGDRLGSRILVGVDWAAAEEWGNEQRPGSRFLGETALAILSIESVT